MRPLHARPVWSRELAYVVGLITTDGNLSSDGRHLEFTSKDLAQVRLLKELLGLNNRIAQKSSGFSPDRLYWRISFGDVRLYRWLVEIGLSPRKSKSLGSLSVPDEYFFDFLRGHLDGDGTIRVYHDPVYPRSRRLYVVFCSASLTHLQWLQSVIRRLLRLQGHMDQATRVWRLNYAKAESQVLLTHIYYRTGIPCLQRKRDLAEQFL